MMERKIEKEAGGWVIYSSSRLSQPLDFCYSGVGVQLRMRRSVLDLASGNVVEIVAVGDLVVGRIVAVGAGVEVGRRGDGAGVVTGQSVFQNSKFFLWVFSSSKL